MRNARCTRNEKIRKEIDDIVKKSKEGSIIFTTELAQALSTRYRSVNILNATRFLRERDDLKLINPKTWQVSKCA